MKKLFYLFFAITSLACDADGEEIPLWAA